jgi:hypothetical protein
VKTQPDAPSRLESQLDTLIRLVALGVAPDTMSLKDRCLRLHRAGLTSNEIAPLCNSTTHIVSVILSAAKKGGQSKRTRAK